MTTVSNPARQGLWRELLQLAWPVLIAQVAVMANGLIDTVMAGRLSPIDLAAVGIGASVYASIFVTVMGVLLALPPSIAHLYGAERHDEIGEEVRQGGWLALALAILTLAILIDPSPLLAISHLQPAVEVKVRAYLGALAWSVPASLAFRVLYGFSAGIGKPRPIMVFNLIGVALKIPLNLVFIHGHLGAPALGAAGCGVASSIVAWTTCLLGWAWCYREPEYRAYGIFSRWSAPRRQELLALIKLGLPTGATFLVDVTAFTFMALFIARLGPTTSGAHQIAANLAALLYMLPLAIGNSTGILAGHALGRGDAAEARHVGLTGIGFGLTGAITVSMLLTIGNQMVAGLYTQDAEVRTLAARLIAIVAIYHLADGLQAVAVNLVRGYKKAFIPMLIYAVFLWGFGLAGGIALGLGDMFGPPRGAPGFWYAATSALSCAGLLVLAYWWRIAQQPIHAAGASQPAG